MRVIKIYWDRVQCSSHLYRPVVIHSDGENARQVNLRCNVCNAFSSSATKSDLQERFSSNQLLWSRRPLLGLTATQQQHQWPPDKQQTTLPIAIFLPHELPTQLSTMDETQSENLHSFSFVRVSLQLKGRFMVLVLYVAVQEPLLFTRFIPGKR